MHAVANNPAVAKKTGVPQSVGKKFVKHGKGVSQHALPQKTSQPVGGQDDEADE